MIDARLDTSGLRPCLQLTGAWTIAYAAQGRERLLELPLALAAGALTVDLHEMTELDTAGMQLMLALSRRLRELGLSADVDGLAPHVQRVARVLGAAGDDRCFGWPLRERQAAVAA